MSNAKDSYTYNRKNFENADFPILCETCLGANPYIRMQKDTHGGECGICSRPYTTFRWMPGRGARYKKTEICQTCAKLKNVCQTCVLDLEYGLPVQVRDHALAIKDAMPKCGANKDFFIQNAERNFAVATDGTTPGGQLATLTDAGNNPLLRKLARTQPYYDRNAPHICSFFVKGECRRGEECPYRHEKPTDPDNPLSQQNMRDRYYGLNDPVAEKLLNRAKALPRLTPPEDTTVTTLYLGNLGSGRDGGDAPTQPTTIVTETDLRDHFYQFGEIRQIHVVPAKCCAFIQFTTRDGAELAAERTFEQLSIKGQKIRVRWGQPRASQAGAAGGEQMGARGTGANAVPIANNPVPNLPTLPIFFPNEPFGGGPPPPPGKRARLEGGGGGEGASAAATTTSTTLPVPPLPPQLSQQQSTGQSSGMRLVIPQGLGAYPYGGVGGGAAPHQQPSVSSSAPPPVPKIYYPSQDPQRLGAKGDVVD